MTIIPDPQGAIADIEQATLKFASVVANRDPLWNAIIGLSYIGRASNAFPDIPALQAPTIADLHLSLLTGALVLADAAAPTIDFDEISMGLGCADSLLFGGDADLTADRRSNVRILCCRLEILAERRAVGSRGNPLLRAMSINRALAVSEPHTRIQ